ncbi:MAG: hypothetical protein GKR89_25525 [Candidatus Latescibacteria bacterium]|nr:hypothetical protein [Candidatus Latescibacterota bacterium]
MDWHPLIVHFPLALLPVAAGLDLAALLARRSNWHNWAYAALVLGVVGAVASVLSGTAAAEGEEGAQADLVVVHEDWATWSLVLFIAVVLGRLPLHLQSRLQGWPIRAWTAVAAAGCLLLWRAAYLGGELVYKHGIGVEY